MTVILPARITEPTDNELRILDAEDDVLCSVINYDESSTPSDYRIAEFIVNAFNTRCPFDGDCEHFDGSSGCDAKECDRAVEVKL